MRELLKRITQIEAREIAIRTFTCCKCGQLLSCSEVITQCNDTRAHPPAHASNPLDPHLLCSICVVPFHIRVGKLLDIVKYSNSKSKDMNEDNVYAVDRNPGCVIIYDKVLAPNIFDGGVFSTPCEFCGRSEEILDRHIYSYVSHSCIKAEKIIVEVAEAVTAGSTTSLLRTPHIRIPAGLLCST